MHRVRLARLKTQINFPSGNYAALSFGSQLADRMSFACPTGIIFKSSGTICLMSRARVVDQRYRLQAKDLGNTPVVVKIYNVSYQGLEQLTPLLHFDGYPGKVLALDHQQCRDLIRLTHSALCNEWIGHTVLLRPAQQEGDTTLVIETPTTPKTELPSLTPPTTRWGALASTLLLLIILGVALGAAYLLEHLDHLR